MNEYVAAYIRLLRYYRRRDRANLKRINARRYARWAVYQLLEE